MGWVVNATPLPFYPLAVTPYYWYRRWGESQDRCGRVRKISFPLGFDSRTLYPERVGMPTTLSWVAEPALTFKSNALPVHCVYVFPVVSPVTIGYYLNSANRLVIACFPWGRKWMLTYYLDNLFARVRGCLHVCRKMSCTVACSVVGGAYRYCLLDANAQVLWHITTHFHMLCSGDNPTCFILLRCYSGGGLHKIIVYKAEMNC
jgi:hypothetical protein